MDRTLRDFEDLLIPYAASAPAVVLQDAARQAVVSFMRTTRIAVDEHYFTGQDKVSDYILDIPECRKLVQVERLYYGPSQCGDDGVIDDQWVPIAGCVERCSSGWWMDEASMDVPVIFINPPPNREQRYAIRYSWTIGRDDCSIPAFIYEDWADAITWGALSRILMMPNQEWTDRPTAMYYQQMFSDEMVMARNRKWSGRQQGPLRMIGRRFL